MPECSPQQCTSKLWQFKCTQCQGKHEWHEYRLWYQKVRGDQPRSRCHSCNRMKDAVPRGEEEGVFICFFVCQCGKKYTVRCTMQDTAPCYSCGDPYVPSCHFEPRKKIVRKTNQKHNCSSCNGSGDCPNMRRKVAFS